MFALTTMTVLKLSLPIIAILVAGPVGRYWRRVGERLPSIEGDRVVLALPRPHVVLVHCCAIALLGGAAYLAGMFFDLSPNEGVPIWLLLILGVLVAAMLAGAVFSWVSLRVRLELDADGLRGRTCLGGFLTIAWSEIASIRYSTRFKSLRMADAAGRRLVAYPFMPGFETLLDQLRLRVPAAIREPAVALAALDPLKSCYGQGSGLRRPTRSRPGERVPPSLGMLPVVWDVRDRLRRVPMSTQCPGDRRRAPRSVVTLALLTAAVAAQEANSPFAAATGVLPLDSAPFQRLLDFDGDGDLDAVGTRVDASDVNAQVFVWRNDNGAFTQVMVNAIGPGHPRDDYGQLAVAVGDFDGNGLQDFVASSGVATWKYLSTPLGWLISSLPMAGTPRVHGAAAGDIDGDGIDDFAIAVRTAAGLRVDLHLATGAVVSTTVASVFGQPVLLAGRLSSSAHDDLVLHERTASSLGGSTAWILGLVAGQMQVRQTLTTTLAVSPTYPLWTVGDIEGDGDADLVVFRKPPILSSPAAYQIFRNVGGTLTAEAQALGGPAEYLADVDGDGDLDGVCCSGGGGGGSTWPQLNFASTFEIAINTGTGFAPAFEMAGEGSRSMAGAADIDGDGDVDLVAGRCVFYGRGPWTADSVMASVPTLSGYTILDYLPNTGPRFEDLDGDADPDMTDWRTGWTNRGDGVMSIVPGNNGLPPAPPGRTFLQHCSIDLDGDGFRDILALQHIVFSTNYQFEQFTGLRSNGAGQFTNIGAVSAPGLPMPGLLTELAAADLDGDGDEDLYVRWPSPASYGIYWNENGTFVAGKGVTTPWPGGIHKLADFDGDGILDTLSIDQLSGYVLSVFRGTGDHNNPYVQATPVNINVSSEQSFAIGDLNDDGKPDIVGKSPVTNDMTIFINTTAPGGPISFASSTLPDRMTSSTGGLTSIADFDGDGRTDFCFTQLTGVFHELRFGLVALRRTNTAIPTVADYVFTRQIFDGAAVDFDGDGDVDVLGSYPIRNARFHGIAAGSRILEGIGTIGEAGSRPLLSAVGPFRTGVTERMLLRGVPGPSVAILGYSLAPGNVPDFPFLGTTLLLDPSNVVTLQIPLPVPSEGRGAGWADVPVTLPPGLFGVTFYLQFYAYDPTAPASVTCSNRMVKTVGL